jgi:hypothetical protein
MFTNPFADATRYHVRHHFGAPGRGVNMAMAAGLIAHAPDVNLERLQFRPIQRQAVSREFFLKAIHRYNIEKNEPTKLFPFFWSGTNPIGCFRKQFANK